MFIGSVPLLSSRTARLEIDIGPAARPASSRPSLLSEVLLYKPRAEVHVELDERAISDALEAVHLAGLDHQDVAGASVELPPVDDPASATLLDELDLVVGMPMRSRAGARLAVEEKHRHVDVAVIGADEVVRAAAQRQVLLANSLHGIPPRVSGASSRRLFAVRFTRFRARAA